MSDKKVKRKVGRPSTFKKEYTAQLLEHFNQPLYIYEAEERMSATGAIKEVMVKRPNDMPTFERFAWNLKVMPDTLTDWSKANEEFGRAYKQCKGVQREFISTHALGKNYSEGFSKFFAINNLGMIERSELKTDNEHKVEGYGLAFDLTRKPE